MVPESEKKSLILGEIRGIMDVTLKIITEERYESIEASCFCHSRHGAERGDALAFAGLSAGQVHDPLRAHPGRQPDSLCASGLLRAGACGAGPSVLRPESDAGH